MLCVCQGDDVAVVSSCRDALNYGADEYIVKSVL